MIEFRLADLVESREILSIKDQYLTRMSGCERSLRTQLERELSEEEYIKFLRNSCQEWDKKSIQRLDGVLHTIQQQLAGFKYELGQPIILIKSSGREEWNSAYTRGNAIILPVAKLDKYSDQQLTRLVVHEIFHIISRNYPGLRNILYGLLGFNKINEVKLPLSLEKRRLTNPDAAVNNYYISVSYHQEKIAVMPVVLVQNELVGVNINKDITKSITVELMVLSKDHDYWSAALQKGKPLLLKRDEVSGLKKQVYVDPEDFFHPEETLAEFFVELVYDRQQVPVRLAQKMVKILF